LECPIKRWHIEHHARANRGQERKLRCDLNGHSINWKKLSAAFGTLSHAEIARACEEAARDAVLAGRSDIDTSAFNAA
jgi:ATP-dependent 26S proteasome regulatory subunit